MTCEDARAVLHGYIDGELDLIHSLEIEKHLDTCSACSRAVENQRALKSAIQGSALHYQPSAAFGRRIDSALHSGARSGQPRTRAAWPWIAMAASVLLAAFFFARIIPGSRPASDNLVAREILDSHLRSLMPGHLTDVESTDRHTVKPWFNGKLDFSPSVEDFAAQGYPLIGGRLDSVSGQTVAALVYQRRKHTINLYIWPSGGAPDAAPVASSRQGYNLIHWTEGSLNYWLASDLNSNELQALVTLLRTNH
jgi:anti-sigma factor RsiW